MSDPDSEQSPPQAFDPSVMDREKRIFFRDALRQARDVALRDAEGFDEIVFVLERLGRFLLGQQGDLGKYAPHIRRLAAASPLAEAVPARWPDFHAVFSTMYEQLRRARNAAMHEGAFARHLTGHAVIIATVIEDALMTHFETIGDFMVRMPVCACLWHPLSFVRQTFLTNSFSFMPVNTGSDSAPEWGVVSDCELAKFLRSMPGTQHGDALSVSLGKALECGRMRVLKPFVCSVATPIRTALMECNGLPILVVSADGKQLLGIATPFDLL